MKIGILARNPRLYSTRRLVEAGQECGHETEAVAYSPADMTSAAHNPRVAKVMGLGVAGVDLLRRNYGPVTMEVSSSASLRGIEEATKGNVAGSLIEDIEKNAVLGEAKTRGKR